MRIDNYVSAQRRITAGVPQGSVLGPVLFSVFVNDVPRERGVDLAMFADDTAVFAVDRNANMATCRLQRQLVAYVDWDDKWKVAVNASKSAAVLFSRRRKMPQRRPRIGRAYLRWTNEVKYLGLHFDRRLTWRTHAQTLVQRATARLRQLFPVLASSAMTRRLGKMIVNTYVLPVITYAAPVWGYLAAMHKRKLQSILDRGLKLAAKVPRRFSSRLLRQSLGVRSLNEAFRRLARKFYARVARHSANPLIADLGRYRIRQGDSWKRPRLVLELE